MPIENQYSADWFNIFLVARSGYKVLGIDLNPDVIEQARKLAGGQAEFVVHDMRRLDALSGRFDAAINMWQSFGYFDDESNRRILAAINEKLNPQGRFIIDIYNRDFFVDKQGEQQFERAGQRIIERKALVEKTLTVDLDYGESGASSRFVWQVYTPEEFVQLASECGFEMVASGTNADSKLPPSPEYPRMQFILQKR